jgi:hypothetical protein
VADLRRIAARPARPRASRSVVAGSGVAMMLPEEIVAGELGTPMEPSEAGDTSWVLV